MFLFLLTAITVSFVYAGGDPSVGCPSTAFLEYANISVIACTFPPMFESVFWYDISDQGPFISYERGSKSGPGYESGEFDIEDDGSLVIHNVTLDHDRQLRVFVHYEWESDIRQEVRAMVYVKASTQFPYINLCKEDNHCHIVIRESVVMMCSVNATRPAADLTWLKMEGSKTTTVPSENYETDVRQAISSFLSTKVTLVNNHFLEVMKCKSRSFAPILEKDYSTVLIEKFVDDYPSNLPTPSLSKRNNNVILELAQKDVYAVVWKKRLPTGIYQTIGYNTYDVSEVYDDVFHITHEGFLGIESLQLEYEGEYLAVYATTTMQTSETFQVHVFIPPTPPFPQIYECSNERNCEIEVEKTGRLTCSLKGIRPLVHLEWIFNGGVPPITFDSPRESIADRGETFDYSVTTSFTIKSETIQNSIKVTCQVAEEFKGLPTMRSNITLVYAEESKEITYCEKAEEKYRIGKKLLIAGASLASSFILCCYCSLWCLNLKSNNSFRY